ncbi:hypothetical protein [Nocardioides zhouii]|nr:hypothetical protein [Nocardioides zhouii]
MPFSRDDESTSRLYANPLCTRLVSPPMTGLDLCADVLHQFLRAL